MGFATGLSSQSSSASSASSRQDIDRGVQYQPWQIPLREQTANQLFGRIGLFDQPILDLLGTITGTAADPSGAVGGLPNYYQDRTAQPIGNFPFAGYQQQVGPGVSFSDIPSANIPTPQRIQREYNQVFQEPQQRAAAELFALENRAAGRQLGGESGFLQQAQFLSPALGAGLGQQAALQRQGELERQALQGGLQRAALQTGVEAQRANQNLGLLQQAAQLRGADQAAGLTQQRNQTERDLGFAGIDVSDRGNMLRFISSLVGGVGGLIGGSGDSQLLASLLAGDEFLRQRGRSSASSVSSSSSYT